MAGSPAPLTWLQAAEHVLREEGPEMHIKDLTTRILELGIVKSNCATSLETLLYRQTSGGPQGKGGSRTISGPSKFIRVSGKHGWFGLKPSVLLEESDLNVSLESVEDILMDDKNSSEREMEVETKPPYHFSQFPKRRNSLCSSDEETAFFMMSTDEEESSEDFDESSEESEEEEEEEEEIVDAVADECLYRKKYNFLKKLAKSIILENSVLSTQLRGIGERISRTEIERDYLLRKLIRFESSGAPKHNHMGITPPSSHTLTSRTNQPPSSSSSSRDPDSLSKPLSQRQQQQRDHQVALLSTEETHAKRTTDKQLIQQNSRLKRPKITPSDVKKASTSPLSLVKEHSNKLLMSDSSGQSSDHWSDSEGDLAIDTPPVSSHTKVNHLVLKKKKNQVVAKKNMEEEDGEDEELELAMRSGKVRRLHPIPLNSDGTPVFPIVVGGLKVLKLGKLVCDRVAYHSERYLLPINFESQRTYPSMIDPKRKCSYTCKILDGGDAPLFEMVAEDDPEHPIRASSSTACQTIVLKNINKARDKQATNSGSGPEFFGYSNPTILNLLQKMPNAKKCSKYKFVRFAEPTVRGAGGGAQKGTGIRRVNAKSKNVGKTKSKIIVPPKKKLDGKSFSVAPKQFPLLPPDSSPAIAPVQMQYGIDLGALSDSSSGDFSSATDNELVIDS